MNTFSSFKKGFQFVTDPNAIRTLKLPDKSLQSMDFDSSRTYVLSIGTTIHCLRMVGEKIEVTRYSIRDPVIPNAVTYK